MAFSTCIRDWKRSIERRWALYKALRCKALARHQACRPRLEVLEDRWLLSTYVVTSTADNGSTGTLRDAINKANLAGSTIAEIDFNIATPGSAQTINLTSQLPALKANGVFINGLSQGGSANTTKLIMLNGAGAGASSDGLLLQGSGNIVSGLILSHFTNNGIEVAGNSNTIGGTSTGAGNVLSGNTADGILIDSGVSGVVVQGNYIGSNAAGTAAVANKVGVEDAGNNNTIGGSVNGSRNVISGNSGDGVLIDSGASGNQVLGNFLGLNANGNAALANSGNGLEVQGSNNTIGGPILAARNYISGNSKDGVLLGSSASSNVVLDGFIGLDISGTHGVGNLNGVEIAGSSNTLGSTVSGGINYISGNSNDGVLLDSTAKGNLLISNDVGTDYTGQKAVANSIGVEVAGAGNTLGATTSAARNIVSGNSSDGVKLDSTGSGTVLLGNSIGVNAINKALGNGGNGLNILSSSNTVGGTATGAHNVLSGNSKDGLLLASGASGNQVLGNYIGTNIYATAALSNSGNGIEIASTSNTIGGTASGARNVISGNSGDGVKIDSGASSNVVLGNYIGLNVNGTAVGNSNGVELAGTSNMVGGTAAAARNIVSGNSNDGVLLDSSASSNQVLGNYIGSNAAGSGAVANKVGVEDAGNNNTIGGSVNGSRNVISGNSGDGVLIDSGASGNQVLGNFLGLNANGNTALANSGNGLEVQGSNNTIGGPILAARNYISGNSKDGVLLGSSASGNLVLGNFIGLDISGTHGAGNLNGVEIAGNSNTLGSTVSGGINYISGNSNDGVLLDSTAKGNLLISNYVGTDYTGRNILGNSGNGIEAAGSDNLLGGTTSRAGNIICGNSNEGVLISAGTGNTISRNSIYNNAGGGIFLSSEANNNITAPTLNSVPLRGNTLTVQGSFTAATANVGYVLEFFANPSGDAEGKIYLGSLTVTPTSTGTQNFTFTTTTSVTATNPLTTTTLTDATGDTSAFSNGVTVGNPGLVAAYTFDQGSGSVLTDVSGNGNNGTIVNATWSTTGKYGDALSFNGTNAVVNIPNATSLQLTTGMTLEAWVNLTAAANGWQDVLYKGNDNYFLESSSSPSNVPMAGATVGSEDTSAFGTDPLPTNSWSFLTETYDGSTLRLYVNSVQVASQALSGSLVTSTNQLQIGGDSIYGQYFQGLIDNVRIYNTALTASQIQADMNTPIAAGTPPPTTPASLTATASGTTITLNWGASSDAIGVSSYVVERENPGSSSFVQIGTTTGTTYTDPSASENNTYNYRVEATDLGGNVSAFSNIASATALFGISPHTTIYLQPGQTQPFTANATGVIWSVNGVVGGSASTGTITSSGLYTAPTTLGNYTVTGTTSDGSSSASASIVVSNYAGTLTSHNDNMRTGANLNETILTPSNVNSSQFGKLFSYPLDGIAFASPLYVPHVLIPGQGYHNVVYVATENDSVYAFDADGLSPTPLWHVSFINPSAGITPIPAADTGELNDIPNEVGITGTPVIDPTTGTIYLVADTKVVANGTTTYYQTLHALDITTGVEKSGGPVVIQGSVPGTGSDAVNGIVTFNPLYQNQHSGLLLSNGVVYFAFSSHGDNSVWHGWVFGYNASTLQQVMVYNDSANGDAAGIWMGADGLASDSTGDIYFTTGNGTFDANTGGVDYGDSAEKISPSGQVLDYFTPYDQATLDNDDLDLNSGGLLLLPDQSGPNPHEMVFAGKGGTVYVVNRDNMGHYNSSNNNQIVQSLVGIFLGGTPETGNFSSPVYYNGYVYFAPVDGTVQAFQVTNGLLSTAPTSQSEETYGGRGGAMAISANGNTNGILWAVEDTSTTTPGVLHAYLATNLTDELYNSNQAGSRDTMDLAAKFSMPLVANGKVYVGGVTQLTVYGLLPNTQPSAAPANLMAQGQVQSVVAATTSTGSSAGAKVSPSSNGTMQSSTLPGASEAISDGPPISLSGVAMNDGWFFNTPSGSYSAIGKRGDPAVQDHMDLLTALADVLGIRENPLNKEGRAENLAAGAGLTTTAAKENSEV